MEQQRTEKKPPRDVIRRPNRLSPESPIVEMLAVLSKSLLADQGANRTCRDGAARKCRFHQTLGRAAESEKNLPNLNTGRG
jgi:hypothetical protein